MTFLLIGGLTLVVMIALIAALLRQDRGEDRRAEHDLHVYRDQLTEIDRDLAAGRISATEAEAARLEVQRRMLKADGEAAEASRNLGQRPRIVGIAFVVLVVPVLALGIYSEIGRPDLALSQAARMAAGPAPEEQQRVEEMVQRLAERMAQSPDDVTGWMLLGRSYVALGRFDDGVAAYQSALKVDPDSPAIYMAYGEAQVFAADGAVTPGALAAFQSALDRDPRHAGARYYLAMARLQAGDPRSALQGFVALANDSPADAPWWPTLEARIREVAQQLGQNPNDLLPKRAAPPAAADGEPAAAMPAEQQAEMIRGMVARLEERLKQQPDDFEGWMRLGRSFRVLNDLTRSRNAYARAAALDPKSPQAALEHGMSILLVEMPNDDERSPLPKEAESEFRRLLALDPESLDAQWYVGEAEARAGRSAEAARLWKNVLLKLDPSTQEYLELKRKLSALPN